MKMPVLNLTVSDKILRQLTSESVFAKDAISIQYSTKAIAKTIGQNCASTDMIFAHASHAAHV